MKPHPPKDYDEEDPYLGYNDEPSPASFLFPILPGLLAIIYFLCTVIIPAYCN